MNWKILFNFSRDGKEICIAISDETNIFDHAESEDTAEIVVSVIVRKPIDESTISEIKNATQKYLTQGVRLGKWETPENPYRLTPRKGYHMAFCHSILIKQHDFPHFMTCAQRLYEVSLKHPTISSFTQHLFAVPLIHQITLTQCHGDCLSMECIIIGDGNDDAGHYYATLRQGLIISWVELCVANRWLVKGTPQYSTPQDKADKAELHVNNMKLNQMTPNDAQHKILLSAREILTPKVKPGGLRLPPLPLPAGFVFVKPPIPPPRIKPPEVVANPPQRDSMSIKNILS